MFIKVFFLFFILLGSVFADSDFLSNSEYAKMLYNNPRGVSCAVCHGERGEGSVMSSYVIDLDGKKRLKEIKAPKINNINMKDFQNAFNKKKRYMPKYYLTKKELAYIYFYLIKQRKKDENNKK